MLKKLAKYNAGRPGLVVALAAVIVLANIGQVVSQQQGTAKTKASEKASPDKSKGPSKRRYFLKPPPKNFTPPTLSFNEPVFDWGSVLQGEVVLREFQLKNTGGSPLKIEKVKPACGCTTVGGDKQVIAPGATGKITLKVDTKKFSGTVRKTAEVYSNASKISQRLTMTGKIELAIEIEPRLPRVQVVKGLPTKPISITLKKAAAHSFKVNKVSSKSEVVDVTMKTVEEGQLYELTVTPKLDKADSRKYHYAEINANVTVKDKSFDLPVKVSITVKERIEASPPSVYFSRRDTDKLGKTPAPPSKQLTIKSLDPSHSFKITGIELLNATLSKSGEHFTTKLEAVTEGKEYKLTVAYAKKAKAGTRRVIEKIRLSTDDPLRKEIMINATASLGTTTLKRNFGSTKKITSGSTSPAATAKPKVFGPIPPAPKGGSK
ncbi:MAG: DUF1573 domain-containing protein [Planctomycetota bacterium]|nr:DUF1573 domain-containing protein [Planctomycetota bacterium]